MAVFERVDEKAVVELQLAVLRGGLVGADVLRQVCVQVVVHADGVVPGQLREVLDCGCLSGGGRAFQDYWEVGHGQDRG